MLKRMESEYTFAPVPESLQPFVEYAAFDLGLMPEDGVELLLTRRGVRFARAGHAKGSHELARWLMSQPQWMGHRTEKNVANEIASHCLFAHWPVISKRANPVNIEYFQDWPISLFLQFRDRMRARLRFGRR